MRGIGTIISMIGYIGVIIVTLDRYWRITAPNPGYEMQLTFDIHYGLWHQCQSGTTSMQAQCQTYNYPITMLPPGLLGKRILMVSGCILGLIASFIGVLSTDAVNTLETSKSKRKAGLGSGCLFLLVGVIVIGAVSYEAAQIVYHSEIKQNQIITGGSMNNAINLHYTLGHDIYIGWITGCLAIGGAVVTICSSMGTPEDEDDNDDVDIEAIERFKKKDSYSTYQVGRSSQQQYI